MAAARVWNSLLWNNFIITWNHDLTASAFNRLRQYPGSSGTVTQNSGKRAQRAEGSILRLLELV